MWRNIQNMARLDNDLITVYNGGEIKTLDMNSTSGGRKLTNEEFVKRVANLHPEIILMGKYEHSKTKIHCKCRSCGLEWDARPDCICDGIGCRRCAGKHFSHDDFVQRISHLHSSIEVIGKYVNSKTRVLCRCGVCGFEWDALPRSLLYNGKGCLRCSGRYRRTREDFIEDLAKINPTVEIVGTSYKNTSTHVDCRCRVCEFEWSARPSDLLRGSACPECAKKKISAARCKTHEQFLSEMTEVNPHIDIIGPYVGKGGKIDCQCVLCGHKWSASASNLLRGSGCPHCAHTQTSFMEKAILMFLQKKLGENNVLSRDRSTIGKELDIYIPSLKTGIEPGSWHWHKTRVSKDAEKYKLCRENNVRVIIIYDSFEETESCLDFNCKDLMTYSNDLGEIGRRQELKQCIIEIFNRLGLAYSFSNDEEQELFLRARLAANRKSHEDIVSELKVVNPNIELLGTFVDTKTKMACRCKICGHEWNSNTNLLINRRYGCPECNDTKKLVINLDTGEVYESLVAAAEPLGLTSGAIWCACQGKSKTCAGYHWSYLSNLSESQLNSLRTQFPETFKY